MPAVSRYHSGIGSQLGMMKTFEKFTEGVFINVFHRIKEQRHLTSEKLIFNEAALPIYLSCKFKEELKVIFTTYEIM